MGLLAPLCPQGITLCLPGVLSALVSFQKVALGIPLPSSQLDFGKQSPSEKTDLASCIQVLDG